MGMIHRRSLRPRPLTTAQRAMLEQLRAVGPITASALCGRSNARWQTLAALADRRLVDDRDGLVIARH